VSTSVNLCLAIFIVFKINDFHEQRVSVKLRESFTETFEMLKTAFGNEALGRTQMYERWKRFRDGRTSTDNDPRSGRQSISKTDEIIAKVREAVRSNRHLTVCELAEDVSSSKTVMKFLCKI
jgi:hypothetical protein